MKLMTLQRNWIPIIVTVVLAVAFVLPVAANEGNNKNHECGAYGYAYGGHTDNESQQGENHESAQAEANDEPCGEEQAGDEAGENDDNGGSTGGGEDKSKNTTTLVSHGSDNKSSDNKSSDNGKSGSSGDGEDKKKGGGDD